jgi:hypothetical protein
VTQPQTSPDMPAQNNADGVSVLDTAKANRAWALASYLDACDNLGIAPDPAMKAELEAMTSYYCVADTADDTADDQVLIEVASYPGTLGSYGEGVAEGGATASRSRHWPG